MADAEACTACAVPFQEGDQYFPDYDGGFIHVGCCGPEPECFVDLDTGEPLKPGEAPPEPFVWSADHG